MPFLTKMAASGSAEESRNESVASHSEPGLEGDGEWFDVLGSGKLRKRVRDMCS